MRMFKLAAAFTVLMAVLVVALPHSAEAGGLFAKRSYKDGGYVQTIGHARRCPRPNFLHRYRRGEPDPYRYCYEPRGYYPYYNSNYWGAPRRKRYGYKHPPYYKAWGGKKRGYRHREWHNRNHGRIRRGHW